MSGPPPAAGKGLVTTLSRVSLRRVPGAFACAAILTGAFSFTLALDPTIPLAQLGRDAWDSDTGLPQNTVGPILQTRDGYLWLGTQEGLVRFDGVRFTVFDTRNTAALKDGWVQSLCQARDGTLWVGTLRGLVRLQNGEFRGWPSDSLSEATIQALFESQDGSLWVGSDRGLSRIRGGREDPAPAQGRFSGVSVRAIAEDREGSLWIASQRGLARIRDGVVTLLDSKTGIAGLPLALFADSDGSVWVGTTLGILRWKTGRIRSYGPADGLRSTRARAVYRDRGGRVWVGTDEGLFAFCGQRFVRYPGTLSSNRILSLFEDREGSLWIGTNDGGLNRLKETRIASYTVRDGLSEDDAWTVFEDRSGDLWVGAATGGLNLLPAGGSTFRRITGLGSVILAIAQDRDGDLWVGTRSTGLFRRHAGRWIRYTTRDGLSGELISSLCAARDGGLWIGTSGGLNLFRGDRFFRYGPEKGLPSSPVFCVAQDRDGDVWVGLIGGGLARLHDGVFRVFTVRDGLAHDIVISVFQDAEGTYWLGTRGGLSRFRDGKFTTYRHREGLFHDAVQRVVEDGRGYLWLTSYHGIFRVSKAELEEAAENRGRLLHPVGFGTGNGMHSAECNNGQQGAVRTRDGRLWFATLKGLAMADPGRIRLNPMPPTVVIESVAFAGRSWEERTRARLPPGEKNLEFHYTALSFRQPAGIHFKYRLENFDRTWVDAGTRRVAYYTNIGAGSYRFVVLAANEDGVWSEGGAVSEFSISPHLYEATWFRALAVLAFAILGIGAHRLHLKRSAARERLRTALVEAQLEALKLQLRPHFLFNTLNSILPLIGKDPGAAKRMVIQLGELLRLSLKSETSQLVTLKEELAFLEQYLEIERTRFRERLEVELDAGPEVLSALVPIFLLQPLAENAIKHGLGGTGHGRIRVTARAIEGSLCLEVSDNGPGYAQGTCVGIGLSNTRSRLEKLYPGQYGLELSNAPSGGGVVAVRFPLAHGVFRAAEELRLAAQ